MVPAPPVWGQRALPPHIQTNQGPFRVAAVDSAIGQHRSRPAFAAEDLRARDWLEASRRSGRDQQLSAVAEHDELAVSDHERTKSHAGVLPFHLASGGFDAAQIFLRLIGIAVDSVNEALEMHAAVEMV